MEKVVINNQIFEYTLKRSSRKTIAIEIGYDGTMIVRAPFQVPVSTIEELLQNKKHWIYENQKKRMKESAHKKDCVYYLGRSLMLQMKEHRSNHLEVELGQDHLVIKKPVGFSLNVPVFLEHWYKKQALALITKTVEEYSQIMQVTYHNITIKDQKTRWGSCSSKGNLNFNYRLIMAPQEVLTYVVVHELAHRIHMDHSRAFWNQVGKVMPDYERNRLWLKEHGHELMR